jgi:NADH-quinone oxidoreductase subunit A
MLMEYESVGTYLGIVILVGGFLLLGSRLVGKRERTGEKSSPYECGFQPFSDAREEYDVRYYLVGILFLLFDLEISFIFPWIVGLQQLTWIGYWTMVGFLSILTLGFIYEWKVGGLDW